MLPSTLNELFINIEQNKSIPQILNPIHKPFTQKIRAINWQKDTTNEIIKKVYASDSLEGSKKIIF